MLSLRIPFITLDLQFRLYQINISKKWDILHHNYLEHFLKVDFWTPIPDLLNPCSGICTTKYTCLIDSPGDPYAHQQFENYWYKYL